ncbi:SAM-dependent methyltransferase [Streptomyces sp. bgisy091]|uniref:SAM-dependent methyltransferase n=1 Tax=Streptomyces sp. bgisy091 TaxID=3413778 RepID=UPI003D705370
MSDHQESSSGRLRTDVPNSARVWNYLLGGKDNHPADAGEMMLRAVPDIGHRVML